MREHWKNWKGQMEPKLTDSRARHLTITIPYIWLAVFFFIPFLIIVKISLSEAALALPPFLSVAEWTNEQILHLRLNIGNYLTIVMDSFYISAFLSSLLIALISTSLCLILGYFIAYGIAQSKKKWRPLLLLLVILPFWTSFLIRVYAWMGLLSTEGIINSFLLGVGLIKTPLPLLHTTFSVIIGIVYCYLPFMILPIYAVLDKIDPVYLEAASDLGCRPWRSFWRVTFPLSFSGVLAGCILVFAPAVGEFVIPELLGAPDTLMIGRVLWMEFFNNHNWPLSSALAVVMLVVFVAPIMIFQRIQLRTRGDI